jgi:hypothetical protein
MIFDPLPALPNNEVLLLKHLIVALGSSGPPAYVGPLDAFQADISNAWSPTRRLFTDYNGSLVRLRRESDNAESDFSADSLGYLDTAAITTWLAGANPFIAKIYAQKGLNDWEQSTASAQPTLSLSVSVFNNRAAALAGDTDGMTSSVSPTTPYSLSVIECATTQVAIMRTLCSGSANAFISSGRLEVGQAYFNAEIASPSASLSPVNELLVAPSGGGNFSLYEGGVDVTTGAVVSAAWGDLCIGASGMFSEPALAYISDILVFDKALDSTEAAALATVSNPATL